MPMRHMAFDADGQLIKHTLNGVPQSLELAKKVSRAPAKREKRDWPAALRPMKRLAKEGDIGLGDIIARTIGPIGGNKFKVWYKLTFGRDCGCDVRQESWNRKYPLDPASF